MLTVAKAIKNRRSTRKFKSDPVPREIILQLLEAARLAPSATNRQPWRFIVVTDPAEKKKIREACLDQAFLEEAPVIFVACADPGAYFSTYSKQRLQEIFDAGVELSGPRVNTYIKDAMEIDPDPKTVIWPAIANTYIAIEHLVLMATALGLGSCWMGGIGDPKALKELFNLPDGVRIASMVAVGYPQSALPPARPRLSLKDILLRPFP